MTEAVLSHFVKFVDLSSARAIVSGSGKAPNTEADGIADTEKTGFETEIGLKWGSVSGL